MSPFEVAARAHIASRGSPGTRELYSADLARWMEFCDSHRYDLEKPTLEAATGHRDELLKTFADLTVRRILSALSSMYDAAGIFSPFKSAKHLQRPQADQIGTTKEFTDEEARKLITAADGDDTRLGMRDATVMQILYDTGLRISTVVRMKHSQLFDRNGQCILTTKVKKKGRVEQVLPSTSVERLDKWLGLVGDSDYVFPATRGRGPVTRSAISKRMVVYGKRVGIEEAHPHRFRVTYITTALDAGLPLNEVQAAVHHSDPKTTQRYDRGVRGAGVAEAVAKFRSGR